MLKAFSLYDNTWGYVQGMNFIAASLIYHSSPDIAFWLFVSLIFDYHLRENYRAGFPGVEHINYQITCKLEEQWPKLYKLFTSTDTDFGMFTLEIIMSLFGIAIPLELTVSYCPLNLGKILWQFFQRSLVLLYQAHNCIFGGNSGCVALLRWSLGDH